MNRLRKLVHLDADMYDRIVEVAKNNDRDLDDQVERLLLFALEKSGDEYPVTVGPYG